MRRLLLALAVLAAPAGARAAVTYVGVGSTAPVISTGTCTPTTASVTRQAGDLLIVIARGEGADGGAAPLSLSTANSFTAVPNASAWWDDGDAVDETGETAINAWYRIATGASDAMPVVADSGDSTSCLLVVFRGVDQTTPIACSASDGTDASDTTGSFPACAINGPGMMLMAEAVTDDAADTSNGATYANANLTSITEREDETSATGLGGGLLVVTGVYSGSGNPGATTYTKDNARRSAYLTVGLKQAAATYSDSFTETATAADSVAQIRTTSDAVTESATASDALAAGLVFPEAITETATASDSLASARTTAVTFSETATASDGLAQSATFPQAYSEVATPADSLTAGLVQNEAFSEAATAGGALASSTTFSEAVTESASAADSVASAATYPNAYTESASATDSSTDNLITGGGTTYSDSFTEAVTATDSLGEQVAFAQAFTEAATAADSVSAGMVFVNSFTESPAASGSLSLKVWDGSGWR